MKYLVEYFVSRSIFVNVLTVLLILVGGYTAVALNKEAFPNIDFDVLGITTIYPGASPEEVEKLVTKPLEDSIKEVDGIKEYNSGSLENRSGIFVKIDPDVDDPQKVIDDIRAAVDRTEDLPEDSEKPILVEFTSSRQPVIQFYLGRVGKNGKYDISEIELRKQAEILETQLEKIKGVARINRQGWRETEMQVQLDPYALERYYISSGEVINALKNRNINFPAGILESKGKEIIVRTIGEFNNSKEIERVVVRANEMGQSVFVHDIARVREGLKDSLYIEKADGYPAISLTVVKRKTADAIQVVDRAREVIRKFQHKLPPHLKKNIVIGDVNDMSFFIRRRLKVLISNGIVGLMLVITSLFIFLGWRTALMATLGIPVAMGMSFIAMDYLGFTMNLISMFGLILVIGIIVDDAIIVCENCYRYIEMGYSPRDSVIKGAQEVVAPVMATISTTIAAFGPMLFMTGIFGKFIFFIPSVVIIALLASLFESFFILPSHLLDVYKHMDEEDRKSGHKSWFEYLRTELYTPFLQWCLEHRLIVLLSINAVFALLLGLNFLFGSFRLFPSAIDVLIVKMEAPRGTPKEVTERFTRAIEHSIKKIPLEYKDRSEEEQEFPEGVRELRNFITRIGIIQRDPNDPFTKRGSQYAMLVMYLTPEEIRNRPTKQIIKELRARTHWLLNEPSRKKAKQLELALEKKDTNFDRRFSAKNWKDTPAKDVPQELLKFSGKLASLKFEKRQGGPPVGRPVALQITGNDFAVLRKIGGEYKALMNNIKGIVDIEDNFEEGKDEMRFHINERLAAQAGISVASAALSLNTAYQGTVATSIKRANEEVDVLVRYDEKFRKQEKYWQKVFIPNRLGRLIPISQIAKFDRGIGMASISHKNGTRLLNIGADVTSSLSSNDANKLIREKSKGIMDKYPGYSIEYSGENKDTQESLNSLGRAFLIGFIIIFMILTSLFQSLSQPIVVVAAIPFSLIGVIIAFLSHGHPLSFLALMGIIGLSGVVVNDSIVLVDFANRIRDENPGWPIKKIVLTAGSMRFRAVMLTTITTVLGLLPTAYGWGGYDPFLVPMALAFSWGLLFATFLTLIMVPILYKTEHNLKLRFMKSYREKYGQIAQENQEI